MPTDGEILAKGRDVRDTAVEKWLEKNTTGNVQNRASVEDDVTAAFDYIVTRFEYHTGRDPRQLDDMRSHLQDLDATLMNTVTEHTDTVKGWVQDWDGDAANSFEAYLGSFDGIKANQRGVVAELITAVDLIQAMLEESRKNLIEIGDEAIRALEAIDNGGFNTSLALSIVSTVTGLAAAPASGGLSLALTTTSAISSIGASVAALEEEGHDLGGDDVEAVLGRLDRALNDLIETQRAVEHDIALNLGDSLTVVQSQPRDLQPSQPGTIVELDTSHGLTDEIREEFEPPRG